MLDQFEFSKRRQRLLNHLGENAAAIIFSAPEYLRNGDTHYPYRQNSDFLYLTGFNEPEAVAVFIPGRAEGEYVLFNRASDPAREIWDGHRAGQEGACEQFGANQAFDSKQLTILLPELIVGKSQLHYLMGKNSQHDKVIFAVLEQLTAKIRNGIKIPSAHINLELFLSEQRLFKSSAEIALMRRAAEVSAAAHCRAMQVARPQLREYHLEAELIAEFTRNGCGAVAYPSIVGAGANACTLHYIENNAELIDGELVLIDAGCEYQGYAADITRTFPVNGHFNAEQRALYEVVLAAQLAAIAVVKPGTTWDKMQECIIAVLTNGLVQLGILNGDVYELIAAKAYLPFYMHNSGHWLGLDVHDVGRYKLDSQWRPLAPGMVLTVEPGLYISPAANVESCWWNMGVRIEDDVLVTAEGYEVLSKHVPKDIAAIEALMATHAG